MKPYFSFLFFCCLLGSAVAQQTEVLRAKPVEPIASSLAQEQPPGINEAARFIAGLPPSGPSRLADWAKTPEWTAFSQAIGKSWQKFENSRVAPIRLWKPSNIPDLNPDTVFYPFSGPDFIYAEAFFPNATTYILCGLEPTGTVPSLQSLEPIPSTLSWCRRAIQSAPLPGGLKCTTLDAVIF